MTVRRGKSSAAGAGAKKKRPKFKLEKAEVDAVAGQKRVVKLKPKKKAKKLRKAIKKGGKGRAKLKVTTTDLVGNSRQVNRVVELK